MSDDVNLDLLLEAAADVIETWDREHPVDDAEKAVELGLAIEGLREVMRGVTLRDGRSF